MAKTSRYTLHVQRLIAVGLSIAAVVVAGQFTMAVMSQNGLLVYGLDKSIGAIKAGDRFDRSVTFCNLTLEPVAVTVVQSCGCADTMGVYRHIAPFTTGTIHLPYHIVDREKGGFTTKAIVKCAFGNGKEVFYSVASVYTVK